MTMTLKTHGNRLEVIPEAPRIFDTSEPVKLKIELDNDWKHYDAYEVMLKYYWITERVKLSKSLECEVPSELINMEVPSYLYDKDHKRTINAELMGIIYSYSGEYAIGLKRSRSERIIIIETENE